MKKSLIYTLMAGILLTGLLSFTLIKKGHHKVATLPAKQTCTAGVTNLVITNDPGHNHGYITFTWTGTGSPQHYVLGGYYQGGGAITGTVWGNTATIPNSKNGVVGGRFAVQAVCSDGTKGGSKNVLFDTP